MKKPRYFFWSASAQAYIHGGQALATAMGPAAFDYDDKIELLTCKRLDMTDEEFAALPVHDGKRQRKS